MRKWEAWAFKESCYKKHTFTIQRLIIYYSRSVVNFCQTPKTKMSVPSNRSKSRPRSVVFVHKNEIIRNHEKEKQQTIYEQAVTWMHSPRSGESSFFRLSLIKPKIFSTQAVNCCLNSMAGYLASKWDNPSSNPPYLKGDFKPWKIEQLQISKTRSCRYH